MGRITFVYPDVESLGLQSLMSLTRRLGHHAELVFYHSGPPPGYGRLRFSNVIKSAFREDREIESPEEYRRIAERISTTNPDLVAFSTVTVNFKHQLAVAAAFKELKPDVTTIFGGVHATIVPERLLERPEIDAVAVGEADVSFPAFLLEAFQDGRFSMPNKPVKGIVFRKNGEQLGHVEEGDLIDLETLPFPEKKDWEPHIRNVPHLYTIMSSRGCPYRCSYCLNGYFCKMRGRALIRRRSVDHVIEELLQAKRRYRLSGVYFWDDSFTSNRSWLSEFCERYASEIGLPFYCLAIPSTLTRPKLEMLKEAGCRNIQVGVQSLDPDINKNVLLRPFNKDKVARMLDDAADLGIEIRLDHILGIPTATVETEEAAVFFYNEHRPYFVNVFWLTYYPRTPIMYIAKDYGILTDKDVEEIESGFSTRRFVTPGGFDNSAIPKEFYGIGIVLTYLRWTPRSIVRFLIRSGLYRVFRLRGSFWTLKLPNYLLLGKDAIRNDLRLEFHRLRKKAGVSITKIVGENDGGRCEDRASNRRGP